MTTRAPVLEAKNNLELVSEIGQLERPARVPVRIDPLRNSQLRGIHRVLVVRHEIFV